MCVKCVCAKSKRTCVNCMPSKKEVAQTVHNPSQMCLPDPAMSAMGAIASPPASMDIVC